MLFAKPTLWREPTAHDSDCYFCQAEIKGLNRKKRDSFTFPTVQSVTLPVAHSNHLEIPKPPSREQLNETIQQIELEISELQETFDLSEYQPPNSSTAFHPIQQDEVNDLVRDLKLSKRDAELLASRLKEWIVLDRSVRVCYYRDRNKELVQFFSEEDSICFCNNVNP